ncbi:hypothetical protein PseudUWO311_14405 [Pseudanabaena sp. UWO311]|uniref:pentapeptide repeat-containing protein n=1 Tax=Pseudanabaena sp. UWO311 TaxID=2487337 RepID=UPI001158A46C|nr:pentapeptide repeat-containing protein [Pseudanabaena sp. UWO311]TYQ25883.1 hypothetical protein PseudUWO311_14405 [Pseudanabaena sp. UWO311]
MTDIQAWPLNIDFTIAVQNPHLCFVDPELKQASTAKNSRGRVLLWSGNFATVYKLTKGNRSWAVRCFTRIPQSDVQQRYKLISEYLSQHEIPYLVDFEFLTQGILVKGEWYPILKMDWVQGSEIDRYIGEHIDDSQVLLRLDRQLKQLQKDLQQVGIAHGDLQHGNIMVDSEGELKLVDYDGMYVPALRGAPPLEVGHPNYQPPMRSSKDFSDRLDEFSFEVISLSLRALASQPNLWETFHEDNKNLIFRQNDFQEPELSPVFQSISNIPDDETRELCDRLIRRCHGKDQQDQSEQPLRKDKIVTQYKMFLVFGVSVFAIVGIIFWLVKTNLSQPQPTVTNIPTNVPVSSPSPSNSPTPVAVATPKLIPITAATLQAKYAEGQRDFRYMQLTGNQGDRIQGQDFSNINLSGSVLERVDLRQIIFKNANLNGIKIVKVDLRGADLSNASLVDANLSFSNLTEANLTQANLLRANLSQTKLVSALLPKAELMKSNLSEADLNAANLKGANLLLANLRKANLAKANLSESNLSAANLSEASLDEANLSSADLRSAELHLTNLSNANLSSANLTAAKLVLIEFSGTNLNGANFRNAIVENIGSIEAADFTNAVNITPTIRKYFCSLASGNSSETGSSTKSTLNCLP